MLGIDINLNKKYPRTESWAESLGPAMRVHLGREQRTGVRAACKDQRDGKHLAAQFLEGKPVDHLAWLA